MNMKQRWEAAVLETATLTPQEALVALVVASRGDFETGTKHEQSVETIARKAKMSERQAQRHVKSLVKKGWLVPNERQGKTTSYSLAIPTPVISVTPDMDDTPDTSDTPTPDIEGQRGDIEGQGGDMDDTPPLTLVTPNTTNTKETTTLDTIEETMPQAAPAAGSSSSSLTEDEQVSFAKIVNELGEPISLEPYVPSSLTTDDEWRTDREENTMQPEKDELELEIDEYERHAKTYDDYNPAQYIFVRAVARQHYEAGVYTTRAIGKAYEEWAALQAVSV